MRIWKTLLQRFQFVRRHLLLLGQADDRKFHPGLLQDREHALHLVHMTETVGAACDEQCIAVRFIAAVAHYLRERVEMDADLPQHHTSKSVN